MTALALGQMRPWPGLESHVRAGEALGCSVGWEGQMKFWRLRAGAVASALEANRETVTVTGTVSGTAEVVCTSSERPPFLLNCPEQF